MKKNTTLSKILTVILVVFTLVLSPSFISKADSLTAAYVYLSRIETDIDGSTEELQLILAVAPTQTIPSGGTVVIEFPDADDGFLV